MPDMWQRLAAPDVLVFLDVTWEVMRQRRRVKLTRSVFGAQPARLAHARQHADLYVHTDDLSALEVRDRVIADLNELGLAPDP